MAKISTTNRSEYYKISSFIFLYFFTWSASIGLLAIWLGQKANLSGTVIGTVFAVNGIFSVILKPIYGYILDKIGMSKYLLYFVVAMSALMAPFFIYVYQPLLMSNTMLGIIVGAIYLSFAWYAGVAACESYTDRYSRLNGMEFGQIRMWGSLGWAVATFFAGLLFNIDPKLNFAVASCSGLVFLVLLARLRVSSAPHAMQEAVAGGKVTLADALRLLTLPRFWALVFFVVGTCIYGVYDQQFPVYFSSQFATPQEGNAMYGYLNSFQVFLEAAGMFCAPWLVNRVGAKNGLIFGREAVTGRENSIFSYGRLRAGGRTAADLHHQTAARRGIASAAGGDLQIQQSELRQTPLLDPLSGGLRLHQFCHCLGAVAAGGLQLREIWLRRILSVYGDAGIQHHLYLHIFTAIRQGVGGSAGPPTFRYLIKKSEDDDLHNCCR